MIRVRRLLPADLPAAAKLAARLVRLHHEYDPLRFMSIEPLEAGYERFLRSQIDREGVVLLVAVASRGGEDIVVGYLLGSLEDRNWSDLRDACGKIHDIYVDETVRRQDVATRLVEDALGALRDLGAPRVLLMTAWQNEPARRLFARLGFRPTMIEMTRESE